MSAKNATNPKPVKCKLNEDDCVPLANILISFNAPISEEHAWALCYQCAKCFKNSYHKNRDKCRLVKKLDQVIIHKDGYVNPKSIACDDRSENTNSSDRESRKKKNPPTEQKLIAGLGYVIFQALDFGIEEDEERAISPQLERILNLMIQRDENELDRTHPETDDEGIEKDSGDCDDDTRRVDDQHIVTLDKVLKICEDHVGANDTEEADSHYRAVCRALVAEVLELSSFLQKVSEGTNDLRRKADTEASSEALDNLNFHDWARLWIQVIRELRHGVKLKKVVYSRTPIEFELTPYEILMEDIRSRRYKLNKVMVNGNIPAPVKKDAHAIILEFIRSRPPLKKASERQLPPRRYQSTPRERLLESIKRGDIKLRKSITSTPKRLVPYDSVKNDNSSENNRFQQRQGSTRRLIKVDYSVIHNTDDDDDDDEEEEEDYTDSKVNSINSDDLAKVTQQNAMCRTGTTAGSANANSNSSCGIILQSYEKNLEPYDLATQCPSRKSMRRHTVVCTLPSPHGSVSVPQSRPVSRNTTTPPADDSLSYTLPEMSWSRNSLQEELFESKQWQDECLSLTLEEIVHIRSVLTKAELESLPVEGHVKEDVEKRKICFLCLKTRFSIFGPWGQICKLCSRTVCSKCYSKMRIPTEHFSHVPVVALSPTLLSPIESEYSVTNAILSRLSGHDGKRGSVGSAPTSPKLSRASPLPNKMSASYHDGADSEPQSLQSASPAHSLPEKRRFSHGKSSGRSSKAEKLKGLEMIVCMDCKAMVIQIIKSSRINRNNILQSLTLDLTPVY